MNLTQEQAFLKTLQYISENSPFYKAKFKEEHLDISAIKSLSQLASLPVTTKEDLQVHNEDFICVTKDKIIDIVTTSGTTDEPITFILTENDLNRLAYNEYISFKTTGMTSHDTAQLMTTLDRRFMAGIAYFLGLRRLGAAVIRTGIGNLELQWDSIKKFKPNYLITVPSFLLKMIQFAEEMGIDYQNSSVKKVICIGEPLRNEKLEPNTLAQKITKKWNIELFSTYASTEMCTAFTECKNHLGGHLIPELIVIEILDDNNVAVPNGEIGELTVTTLGVEGMPLLRYKTGDLVYLNPTPCSCHIQTPTISPVLGRKKQMIKYKGTTLFPQIFDELLTDYPSILNYAVQASKNELGLDELTLFIATNNSTEKYMNDYKAYIQAKLRVVPNIIIDTENTINQMIKENSGRKINRFIDKR